MNLEIDVRQATYRRKDRPPDRLADSSTSTTERRREVNPDFESSNVTRSPASCCAFALNPDDEAAPALRVRVLAEPVVDAVDDLVELTVCERPDEDHAGMLATRF
jgi:hypothetical protein